MSLLRDIQDAAIDQSIDVTFLLRKCKVLAARLGNEEFNKWVDDELNGYKIIEDLPDYRILSVESKGHFSGYAGRSLRNANIPLSCIDKKFRKVLEKSYGMQPISAYVDLLANSEGGGSFQDPWPNDIIALVGRDIYQHMNCLGAWKVIPRGSVVALVDAVRNSILNFVLQIEAEAPNAGEALPNTPPLPQSRVTQVFHTHIYGNVGNIAKGSQYVTQSANMTVSNGSLESLKSYLKSVGLQDSVIKDLEAAIQSDDSDEVVKTRALGTRVNGWLGTIFTGIAQGAISLAENVNANLIAQAILMYYGIQ